MAEYRDPTHLTEKERKNINLLATAIRQKMYGIDVREAIALAIELTFDTLAKENNDAYGEVIQARGVWDTLEKRLDNLSVNDINKNLGKLDSTYFSDEFLTELSGGTINATNVLDGTITTPKIVNEAVTASKVSDSVDFKTSYLNGEYPTNYINFSGTTYTDISTHRQFYSYIDKTSSKIADGGSYTIVFKTTQNDSSWSQYFRANTRSHSDTVIQTYYSEYLGKGLYVVKGIQVSTDTKRIQMIAQLPLNSTIATYVTAVELIDLSVGKINPIIEAGNSIKMIKDASLINPGDVTPTLVSLHDTATLPVGGFVRLDFNANDLAGAENTYNFVWQTTATDNSLSDMFRTSISGVINERSKYLGNGKYGLLDLKLEEGVTNRITLINEGTTDFTISDLRIGVNGLPSGNAGGVDLDIDTEVDNYAMVQVKRDALGVQKTEVHDYNLYPLYPVWGHEYLWSWYEKLRLNEAVTMVWAGDSTTQNGNLALGYKRDELATKIMTLGGYPNELITSINSGQGTQHTGNWLGGDLDEDKRTPNGFLYEDMALNPDLYVLAYGFNDGSNGHFPELSWQERIDRFEENMIEGLERIRGTQYNRTPNDMAIIICTPISGNGAGLQTAQTWGDRVRPIIQRLCREYKCAFVDIAARQYDRTFSTAWSSNGDGVHPLETANADYMSMFADLLYPLLLHK